MRTERATEHARAAADGSNGTYVRQESEGNANAGERVSEGEREG